VPSRIDGRFMGIISAVGYTISLVLVISLVMYPLILCFRPNKKIEKKHRFMSTDDPKADSMYAVKTEIAFPTKKNNRKIDSSLQK
uniref:Uncharacterized protein n=1 Tax=Parascaris univalens TaxID=6257 RepID=A0A914ZF63_PARUN